MRAQSERQRQESDSESHSYQSVRVRDGLGRISQAQLVFTCTQARHIQDTPLELFDPRLEL